MAERKVMAGMERPTPGTNCLKAFFFFLTEVHGNIIIKTKEEMEPSLSSAAVSWHTALSTVLGSFSGKR